MPKVTLLPMKLKLLLTLLLILASLFVFTNKSQAQLNAYFKNNPVWQINSSCSIGGPCIKNDTYNYYTKGDTLIDSLNYVQIFRKGQGFYDWQAPFQNPGCLGTYINIDTQPLYFVRSEYRQIAIRFPGDTAEQLLFDFNLAIGDTLPITYNNKFRDIVVSGIDSVATPNGFMKRFALSGATWSQYLIEGIGHTRGFTEPLKAPLECSFSMNCYGLKDSAIYPSVGASCTIAIGIANYPSKIALSIFPNPFNKSTSFEFDPSLTNLQLKIFSIFGQELTYNFAEPKGKITFEKGNLSSGIYFYELIHTNQVKASGKIILE